MIKIMIQEVDYDYDYDSGGSNHLNHCLDLVLAGMKQFGKSVRWLSGRTWWRRGYMMLAVGVFLGCCVALGWGGE